MGISDEESNLGANSYQDRAVKAFARYGISLNTQQFEGEPYRQLYATLDYIEGASDRIGMIYVSFDGSLAGEPEDYLEVGREISQKGGFGAGVSCRAAIVNGEVKEYKIHFRSSKTGYVVELGPDGVVKNTYQEYSENDDQDYPEVASLIQKFPTFPVLVQRFTTTPLDPDKPASLFSLLGDLPDALATRLALEAGT